MKIVITDGFTLNPGDLSWKTFDDLGAVTYYDRTTKEEVLERVRDADVIITNKTAISSDTITRCKNLKLIAVTATGYNVIDINAARQKKVVVCNVPEYGTHSVAQHAIALMLALSNRVIQNSDTVHRGEWARAKDWCYSTGSLIELKDKILGIVGMGRIGNQTAKIAQALGMQIIYNGGSADEVAARSVSMQELFSTADFISLHCPLKPSNEKFVNANLVRLMKPTAYLINTSRGQLVDEMALAEALKLNLIAGAALDVLSAEPPIDGNPLIGLGNCVITPHTAWLSKDARSRIMQTTFENVKAFLSGHPNNVVQ